MTDAISRWIGNALVVAATGAALAAGRTAFLALAILLGVLAGGELLVTARARGDRPAGLLTLGGIAAVLSAAHVAREDAQILLPAIVAGAIVVSFVAMMARGARAEATRGLGATILPVVLVGFLGAFAVAIRGARAGFRLALVLLVAAAAAELAAAVTARFTRGRPLVADLRGVRSLPSAGASIAGGSLSGWIASVVSDAPLAAESAVVLGALVGLAATLADLALAMLDRGAPASLRGRIFERVDGVLFASPVFFYAFRALER